MSARQPPLATAAKRALTEWFRFSGGGGVQAGIGIRTPTAIQRVGKVGKKNE